MTDKAEPEKETCCVYRRKIVVAITHVLPEAMCGVSDVELADLFDPDRKATSGKPVIAFRYCPWCGEPFTPSSEMRVTDLAPAPPEDDDEPDGDWSQDPDAWKNQ